MLNNQKRIKKRKTRKLHRTRTNGCLYPLAWNIIRTREWWSPAEIFCPEKDSNCVDRIVVYFWALEVYIAGIVSSRTHFTVLLLIPLSFLIFRLLDILFTLLSMLIQQGHGYTKWRSYRRAIILVMANVLEIIFIFAIWYRTVGTYCLDGGKKIEYFSSFCNAFYFSVVTATTLGYGDMCPADSLSKALPIVETLMVFLIAVVLISFIAGTLTKQDENEENGDKN
jgi:voltage-gated potassium channel Kch